MGGVTYYLWFLLESWKVGKPWKAGKLERKAGKLESQKARKPESWKASGKLESRRDVFSV